MNTRCPTTCGLSLPDPAHRFAPLPACPRPCQAAPRAALPVAESLAIPGDEPVVGRRLDGVSRAPRNVDLPLHRWSHARRQAVRDQSAEEPVDERVRPSVHDAEVFVELAVVQPVRRGRDPETGALQQLDPPAAGPPAVRSSVRHLAKHADVQDDVQDEVCKVSEPGPRQPVQRGHWKVEGEARPANAVVPHIGREPVVRLDMVVLEAKARKLERRAAQRVCEWHWGVVKSNVHQSRHCVCAEEAEQRRAAGVWPRVGAHDGSC
mmetsp:Transcript_39613/g.127315  ORF Transcript_39613/g.127315 Transcript_39613/m.127315 type:complete len:264 (-) Transcript_39613:313-1104(-)